MISVVMALLNEKDSLAQLHGELCQTADKNRLEIEFVFVDDGSTDGSWQQIRDLAGVDPRVRGVRFRRNFGKAAAIVAGVRAARGDIILTMDADLQDDPAEIPRFLAALGGDLDIVSGWKKKRHDPWHKVWPSRVFNWLVGLTTGVRLHDHNCGMKCYRAEVFREIRLYGELHRLIPILAAARGFRIGELVIQHRPRKFGRSKYGIRRFVKGFLDLLTVKFLTGFGGRPQHLLGTIGLASFVAGLAGLAYLTVIWFLRLWRPEDWDPLHTRPLLTYSAAALIVGVQVMSIGFLAELITAYSSRDEDAYSVAERVGMDPEHGPLRPAARSLTSAPAGRPGPSDDLGDQQR